MYTYSEKHVATVDKVHKLSKTVKTIQELATLLKKNNIAFEALELASGCQLLIFTGSSGYDIVGVSVKNDCGKIVLEEIFS